MREEDKVNRIRQMGEQIVSDVKKVVCNDELRTHMMFEWLNVLLAIVSLFMTVVNIFTKEYTLMTATFAFFLACMLNVVLTKWSRMPKKPLFVLFAVESLSLLLFFFISGIPNGFSALWVCLIPSFALLIFGRRTGTIYSLLAFWGMVVLFWIPGGRMLLLYEYTEEFMLRFPFFYAACFLLALFIEVIRAETQRQLQQSEREYKYLYRHDALTKLNNRYGFREQMQQMYAGTSVQDVAVMILDIDDFKKVNDEHGHIAGDLVLKHVAEVLMQTFCEHTVYCRWGGEEFLAFLHCGHDYDEMAETIRRRIAQMETVHEEKTIRITCSVGLCKTAAMKTEQLEQVIQTADNCLYTAKRQGKNQVVRTSC